MSSNMRRPRLIIGILGLMFLLRCASTPPPQLNPNELNMLAQVQREKGERSGQIALECLQETKLIQQEEGREKALEYLMGMGIRYPYEAMKVREILFGEHVSSEFDHELEMLAEIKRERGERNAQMALKVLRETKLIQQKEGGQKALDYLMRVGTRYPYEALKIRETFLREHGPGEFDDELRMLVEIQGEKGERSAQIASRLLQQTKLIRQKSGRQKALDYLMRIGTRYPYEATKIRETLFGEPKAARKTALASKEDIKARKEPTTPPSSPRRVQPTERTGKRDLRGADFFSQGMQAYENGEYQLCIDKLSQAIPLLKGDRERIDAFKTMALAYMAFPKKRQARQQFCNILALDPSFELDPIMTHPKILTVFQEARGKCLLSREFRKKFALCIGISEYRYHGANGLTNLLFADDDAHDFSKALK